MAAINKSGSDVLASDTKMLAGFQQNQASLPSFTFAGQVHTPADCEAVFQARIAAGNAVVTSRGIYQKAVAANRAEIAATKVLVANVKDQLILMHSDSPEILAQYGLVPRKKAVPKTAAEQVVIGEKKKSTRVARGTKGSVQRAKVKGTVPATITITTAGATTVPAAPEALAPAATAMQKADATSK